MNKMILLLFVGTWLGLVIGISFVEAPLKFLAPNITIELGLGIGKLVFGALNRIEILISLTLALGGIKYYLNCRPVLAMIACLCTIVFYQYYWLLPALDHRIELRLSGNDIGHSYHHILYVILEITKLITLPILFNQLYKEQQIDQNQNLNYES